MVVNSYQVAPTCFGHVRSPLVQEDTCAGPSLADEHSCCGEIARTSSPPRLCPGGMGWSRPLLRDHESKLYAHTHTILLHIGQHTCHWYSRLHFVHLNTRANNKNEEWVARREFKDDRTGLNWPGCSGQSMRTHYMWGRQERGYLIVNSIYYDISPLPWLSHPRISLWKSLGKDELTIIPYQYSTFTKKKPWPVISVFLTMFLCKELT